ncbi:MAG: adenosylcobinamide-GDP ribazoletransferase [Sphaerochaetaceae bacterium]
MINIGLGGALRTLTRFPLPYRVLEQEQRILFWFPFVGFLYGLISIAVSLLPLSSPVLSVLIISVTAYFTRGFHLDGLCDFADGLGGGWEKERALAIMKDSHSGAFALITLFCTLLFQYAALLQLVDIPLALLWVPMLGRLEQVLAAAFLPYAREEGGTASLLVRSAKIRHAILPLLQVLLVLLLFVVFQNQYAMCAFVALAASMVMGIFLMVVSQRRLGGVTGDVLGAIEILSESAAMLGFLLPLATQALSR